MKFELKAMLDKIKIDNEIDKETNFRKIKGELEAKAKKYDFVVLKETTLNENIHNSLEIRESYYSGIFGVCQGIDLTFQSTSYSEDAIKAIYETFYYLSNLTDSKAQWSIETEYRKLEKVQKAKYRTVTTQEIIAWYGTADKEIDFIDFLKYASCERALDKREDEFDKIIMQLKKS